MSEIISPRVLKGFRDALPSLEIKRKDIQRKLETSFENSGFLPIDTPALEYREVLLGKGGGETDKQVYTFQDHGGRDVAMRFDLTVPLARFMAAHVSDLPLPFKRYHIAKVWRGENTQRGRYREFFQCDFDIVGPDCAAADFEILFTIYHSLENLGVKNFQIHLSHRGIFNAFLANHGLKKGEADILRAVDKRAKIGEEKMKELLVPLAGEEKTELLLHYIGAEGTSSDTLEKLEGLVGREDPQILRVRDLLTLAEESGIGDGVILDPAITRGLDYYTGVVYETFLTELPQLGSVCSGGRYNNLAGLYTKRNLPGVGASIGLDRLLAGLEDLGRLKSRGATAEVLIFNMDDALLGHYFSLARALRTRGIASEVFLESRKINKQFQFAEKRGIPYALICGEEEYRGGRLNLKNLESRESREGITLEEAAAILGG